MARNPFLSKSFKKNCFGGNFTFPLFVFVKFSLKKIELQEVSKRRAAHVTGFFLYKIQPSAKTLHRIAFAFSRKSGSAVLRNLFKRRFRETLRLVNLPVSVDIVCIARSKLSQLTPEIWKNEQASFQNFLKNQSFPPSSQGSLEPK